jgi:hypothetical protein
VLVLAPIAIGSIASAYQHGLPNANLPAIGSRLSAYATVLVEEWFVVLLIWLALRRRGLPISRLVSGRWQTLGWLLGLLAYWRKSLRPGMLAHGLQDSIGGLVSFFS